MPYVRFSRDKRGYESTYVLHVHETSGAPKPRLLYWFRTPPDVKVGRAALDEDALRVLEASNPGVSFDWKQLLKSRPPTSGRSAETPAPNRKRQGQQRVSRGKSPQPRDSSAAPFVSESPPPLTPSSTAAPNPDAPVPVVPLLAAEADTVSAEEPRTTVPSRPSSQAHPVVTLLGEASLQNFRARYDDLEAVVAKYAKASNTPPAADTQARLRRVNPDSWETIEDAVQGIERFNAEVEVLRQQLDQKPD